MLPSKGWGSYEADLRALGEHRGSVDPEAVKFLNPLGLCTAAGELTIAGNRYFHLRFIEEDESSAIDLLWHQILTSLPEAAVITQLLGNRPKVRRAIAETVLRAHGYDVTDRQVGSLLALLARAGIIYYAKREGAFRVSTEALIESPTPASMFIAPETPWRNRIWLRRVLSECTGFIYWLDKHFLPEGLDFIGEAADGARLSNVRVLSLAMEENKTRKAKRAYRNLAHELQSRGIEFEWRFIDSKDARETHDRWIVSDGRAWNVPNLNAILSGQHSEIMSTANADELRKMFEALWTKAPQRPADPPAGAAAA